MKTDDRLMTCESCWEYHVTFEDAIGMAAKFAPEGKVLEWDWVDPDPDVEEDTTTGPMTAYFAEGGR